MGWFEKAEQELNEAHERGEISVSELNKELRDLRRELEMQAQENAENAYNDTMGGW